MKFNWRPKIIVRKYYLSKLKRTYQLNNWYTVTRKWHFTHNSHDHRHKTKNIFPLWTKKIKSYFPASTRRSTTEIAREVTDSNGGPRGAVTGKRGCSRRSKRAVEWSRCIVCRDYPQINVTLSICRAGNNLHPPLTPVDGCGECFTIRIIFLNIFF